jgi:hypothetical protein
MKHRLMTRVTGFEEILIGNIFDAAKVGNRGKLGTNAEIRQS